MSCPTLRKNQVVRPRASAVHDRAVALMMDHLSRHGAPWAVAELLAAELEPIMVEVSRDREAQPVVLLDVHRRVLTIHRFSTIAGAKAHAELNQDRGRWYAGVNLGQLLELAADQVRAGDDPQQRGPITAARRA